MLDLSDINLPSNGLLEALDDGYKCLITSSSRGFHYEYLVKEGSKYNVYACNLTSIPELLGEMDTNELKIIHKDNWSILPSLNTAFGQEALIRSLFYPIINCMYDEGMWLDNITFEKDNDIQNVSLWFANENDSQNLNNFWFRSAVKVVISQEYEKCFCIPYMAIQDSEGNSKQIGSRITLNQLKEMIITEQYARRAANLLCNKFKSPNKIIVERLDPKNLDLEYTEEELVNMYTHKAND